MFKIVCQNYSACTKLDCIAIILLVCQSVSALLISGREIGGFVTAG